MFRNKKTKENSIIISLLLVAYVCAGYSPSVAAYEYNSISRRDPFVPLVGVSKGGSKGSVAGILTIDDVSLQGILVNPGGERGVVINGEIMLEGQTIERVTIISIGNNAVKLSINGEEFDVKLYE